MPSEERLFWMDLEMSGLDPEKDRILEAAAVVTSLRLEELESFDTPVYQPQETLAGMNDWCRQQHGSSGLTAKVNKGLHESQLDDKLCQIADRYFQANPVILAGNSIAHDRRFVEKYLPKFSQRLHYRMLDVSSFKIVFASLFNVPYGKNNHHRALDDIRESIGELRYYIGAIDPSRLTPRG
jgi:oligoribonuclease